jgi:acyl transferase domain-containing protein
MNPPGSAVLFPGQGTLHTALLGNEELGAAFRAVVDEIGWAEPSAPTPESTPMLVFAASVAHYRVLVSAGLRPAALVGHSFGELAALVCAGAFTVAQGAAIVRQRSTVLDASQRARGGMVTAAAGRTAVERLVAIAAANHAAVAAENGPAETVVSGTNAAIDAIRRLAARRRVAIATLKARYALHCPALMVGAALELARQLRSIESRLLQVPVFSPILGRYYAPSDDLAECLASHLALPVRFAEAVRTLSADGIGTFVECGPLRGLARHVREITATPQARWSAAVDRLPTATLPPLTGVRHVQAADEAA